MFIALFQQKQCRTNSPIWLRRRSPAWLVLYNCASRLHFTTITRSLESKCLVRVRGLGKESNQQRGHASETRHHASHTNFLPEETPRNLIAARNGGGNLCGWDANDRRKSPVNLRCDDEAIDVASISLTRREVCLVALRRAGRATSSHKVTSTAPHPATREKGRGQSTPCPSCTLFI